MAKSAASRARAVPAPKRKNILIDQSKLDAAKAALGALTETAAVDAALDQVVFRAEVFAGLNRLASAQAFGAPVRPRRAG